MERKEANISLRMEEARRRRSGSFNPFLHPGLTRLLSLVAPHFYTQQELSIIEELHSNNGYQQKKPSFSDAKDKQHDTLNCRKRSRYSLDHHGGSTFKKQRSVKPTKNQKDETTPTPFKSYQNSSSFSSLNNDAMEKQQNLNCRKRSCYSTNHHEGNTSKKQTRFKAKKNEEATPTPTPHLPISVKNIIKDLNGTDIKFVMCKKLFSTDLNPYNNRLSLPLREIKTDFLTEKEKAILDSKKDDGKPMGLEVSVLDPYFKEFTMDLKKWQMGTSCVYNLVRNWRLLLSNNNDNMQKGNELNVWSFRVDGKLNFTLNKGDN